MPVLSYGEFTVVFNAIDSDNRSKLKSGISWATGDVKFTSGTADFTNTTNLPVELHDGKYSYTHNVADYTPEGGFIHIYISKSGIDDVDILVPTTGHYTARVTATSRTDTAFTTTRTETTTDFWANAYVMVMTSPGTTTFEFRKITAYDGTTKAITLDSALAGGTPAVDTGLILITL